MTVRIRELASGREMEGKFVEVEGGKVSLWTEIGMTKGTGQPYGWGRKQEAMDYLAVEVVVDELNEIAVSEECRVGLRIDGVVQNVVIAPHEEVCRVAYEPVPGAKKRYVRNSSRLNHKQFEELVRDSQQMSLRALAQRYGVSHETIRKYLGRHGIPTHR